jgi:hypothetical protein
MNAIMSEWETFCDISYYHLWRVRRKNERGFNDGYHLQNGEEAQALVELLNGLERERGEVTKDLEFRRELYKVQEQCLETARAELSLKCQSVTIASGTISDLLKKSELLEKQIGELERERDEAREALMKIEDLFIDGTDIYADREKMGIIARAALEGANSDFHREMREKAERERDEARAELDAHREAGHLCDSHRDMMGDCIVCSMEEKNERVLRG